MAINSQPSPQTFIGAVEDLWELFSDNSSDYTLGSPIGFGASSIVYSAIYRPTNQPDKQIPCALKVLDLDSLPPRSLALLQRETTLMSLSKHPNVLRVRGSWMDGHRLHIALRLMNKGSAADVMAYGWPGGMEEEVIRCILQQALQGLNYLHVNGFIHRDIKAANLLIDDDGTVLLGDLGVAADLSEDSSQQLGTSTKPHRISSAAAVKQPGPSFSAHTEDATLTPSDSANNPPAKRSVRPNMGKRQSFVGTPCWMAPELIQGKHYDSSADIWSFGITAIELTQGRPPRSRETPQKVLLRTIQEAPPTLDREGGTYKYSKAFQDMVESCLVKDPSKRPSAEQLLATPFFKGSKKKPYLVNTILKDLPPLTQRQQRRVLPATQNRTSFDSWDFATTVHSVIPHSLNLYNHRRRRTGSEDPGDAVFEMEYEQQDNAESDTHSRTVSWVDHKYLEIVEDEPAASTSPFPDVVTTSIESLGYAIPLKGKEAPISSSPSLSPATSSSFSTSSKPSSPGLWKRMKSAAKLVSPTRKLDETFSGLINLPTGAKQDQLSTP